MYDDFINNGFKDFVADLNALLLVEKDNLLCSQSARWLMLLVYPIYHFAPGHCTDFMDKYLKNLFEEQTIPSVKFAKSEYIPHLNCYIRVWIAHLIAVKFNVIIRHETLWCWVDLFPEGSLVRVFEEE